jgi:hypothetical protein
MRPRRLWRIASTARENDQSMSRHDLKREGNLPYTLVSQDLKTWLTWVRRFWSVNHGEDPYSLPDETAFTGNSPGSHRRENDLESPVWEQWPHDCCLLYLRVSSFLELLHGNKECQLKILSFYRQICWRRCSTQNFESSAGLISLQR